MGGTFASVRGGAPERIWDLTAGPTLAPIVDETGLICVSLDPEGNLRIEITGAGGEVLATTSSDDCASSGTAAWVAALALTAFDTRLEGRPNALQAVLLGVLIPGVRVKFDLSYRADPEDERPGDTHPGLNVPLQLELL